jgi:hypothetical protein
MLDLRYWGYLPGLLLPLIAGGQDQALQKPVIDTAAIDQWPAVGNLGVSPAGNYMLYAMSNQPAGNHTMVIRSIHGNRKKALPGVSTASFTDDGRHLVMIRGNDSLCIMALKDGELKYIDAVKDFRVFTRGKNNWIAYRPREEDALLVLYNMKEGRKQVVTGVSDYLLDNRGNTLLFVRDTMFNGGSIQTLNCLDIGAGEMTFPRIVWKGRNDLRITGISDLSLDGERLILTLQEKVYQPRASYAVNVNIWSYKDPRLQSRQLMQEANGVSGYAAVLNLKTSHIIRLQYQDEEIQPISNGKNDEMALIIKRTGEEVEEAWNRSSQPAYYLVSLRTGQREQVSMPFAALSPGGRYLVGDDGKGNCYTREIATGNVYEVTRQIPVPPGDAGYDKPFNVMHRGLGFWGYWLDSDTAMLVYDRYDIWQVDPQNKKPPLNLTRGYGRRHNITFRFIAEEGTVFRTGRKLILDAFDNGSKNNGFYSMVPGSSRAPRPLSMSAHLFYARDRFYLEGMRPVQINNRRKYIVRRCSATSSPNYYLTRSFRHFVPLTNISPESRYNWLSAEQVAFTTLDGRQSQGVLYKPENFNPAEKYPLIVHCYETGSERLNQYRTPGFSAGDINIPYFVSRGYLVFIPDIRFTIGKTGESAYNSVVAGVKHLCSFPWVDARKIGISSRSFGSFLVNYIITRANIFAAACSDAGVVNLAAGWGTYELNTGSSLHDLYERTYYRIGAAPWERPDLYIENSPLFRADKVTTPVLLVNNRLDAVVHMEQGIRFFTALRRSGKKAWMLSYPGEGHNLLQRTNQLDLTLRIEQFFDHYLKGAPAPAWMAGAAGSPVKVEQK